MIAHGLRHARTQEGTAAWFGVHRIPASTRLQAQRSAAGRNRRGRRPGQLHRHSPGRVRGRRHDGRRRTAQCTGRTGFSSRRRGWEYVGASSARPPSRLPGSALGGYSARPSCSAWMRSGHPWQRALLAAGLGIGGAAVQLAAFWRPPAAEGRGTSWRNRLHGGKVVRPVAGRQGDADALAFPAHRDPARPAAAITSSVVVATTDEGQPDGHPRRPVCHRGCSPPDLQDRPYAVERCVPGGESTPTGASPVELGARMTSYWAAMSVDLGTAAGRQACRPHGPPSGVRPFRFSTMHLKESEEPGIAAVLNPGTPSAPHGPGSAMGVDQPEEVRRPASQLSVSTSASPPPATSCRSPFAVLRCGQRLGPVRGLAHGDLQAVEGGSDSGVSGRAGRGSKTPSATSIRSSADRAA